MFNFKEKIKNQQVNLSSIKDKNIEFWIKREDTIHPLISGNKFRKLKYNIQQAEHQKKKILLTFGGAFSNHILAVACAGNTLGFKTIGIIRGDELAKDTNKTINHNPTLKKAYENGMQFYFISREEYRKKSSKNYINQLKEKFGDFHLIPQGGTNVFGVQGCKEILKTQDSKFDYICCPVGTGGTISGLINSAKNHQKIIGFSALKDNFSVQEKIKSYISNNRIHWNLQNEYHFGGYAKYSPEFIMFVNQFKKQTTIPLDPIYTGKMVFGIVDLIMKNKFPNGCKILAIHTGGLQGIKGFNQCFQKKNIFLES